MGGAVAQTRPTFAPAAGPALHLLSQDNSTATARCEVSGVSVPYRVSWWLHVEAETYDDFVIYQASDEAGQPTDVTIMFRERPEKMPESPEDWRGMVWVQDAAGPKSVCSIRRPGWHRVEVVRKSAGEVVVRINSEEIGTYQARSGKPARKIEVGDANASEGAGEAYWAGLQVTSGLAGASKVVAASPWVSSATGAGLSDYGVGLDEVEKAHLYLHNRPGKEPSKCEAVWGDVKVEIPYQFWCQVYVSEQPYQDFSVICPFGGEGKPTDVEVEFQDPGARAAPGTPAEGFVWVIDANGRHAAGSASRGVWHEIIMRRQSPREVIVLIDDRPVGTFASRSQAPVTRYRFGDFGADQQRGEAYWYRIRLVPIPKD